tara:strand:- start:46 stop:273 length:228 start_codon:yes stop_codon:yes gene_type:complete
MEKRSKVKTIEVDTPFKKKPKDIKEVREKNGVKTIQVEVPFKKKPKHVQPDPRAKGIKGVRIAKRGGGRAYGKNS